jgi:hypothetical protein
LGRHVDALPHFERAYEVKRAPDWPGQAREKVEAEHQYGLALYQVGRYADAEPRLLGSYRAALATDGFPPASLNLYLTRLAELYVAWGKPDEAAKWRAEWAKREADDVRQSVPVSPELARRLTTKIATPLLDAGAFAEAEPVLREALAIRQTAAPNSWTTFNTMSMLGGALLGQKKYAEAEPLLVQGYEGMKAREEKISQGPLDRRRIPEAIDRLIELYTATNRPEEAAKWRTERAKYPFVAPPPREVKR